VNWNPDSIAHHYFCGIEERVQVRVLCADEVKCRNVLLDKRPCITIHAYGAVEGLIFNDVRYLVLHYDKIPSKHGIGDDVSDTVALQTVTTNYPDFVTNLQQ